MPMVLVMWKMTWRNLRWISCWLCTRATTATDEAIARAVRWRAPLTLVAPCCHHDLQVRVKRACKNTAVPAVIAARDLTGAVRGHHHGRVSSARVASVGAQSQRGGMDRRGAHGA